MKKMVLCILTCIVLVSVSGCSLHDSVTLPLALNKEIYNTENLLYTSVGYYVYKIDEVYSVVVYNGNYPVGKIDFSAERVVCNSTGIQPVNIEDMQDLLKMPFDQITAQLGNPHLDSGSGFYIPTYISEDGYLFCFKLSENNQVIGIIKWDILNGTHSETIWE